MNYQPPSEGIMMNYEYPDVKAFSVACTCHNPDDTINVLVETDEFGEITVLFDIEAKTKWWKGLAPWNTYKIDNPILYFFVNSTKELVNGLHQRITLTWKLWVNGYLPYNANIILNKQRALNFAESLKTAVEELEKKK